MNITEIQIHFPDYLADNLLAYARIVIDDALAVNDLKIIHGSERVFVAMPTRQIEDRCPFCKGKNRLAAKFCSWCARELGRNRAELDDRGRERYFNDVVYPINPETRAELERRVLEAYAAEYVKQRDARIAALQNGEAR